MKAKANKSTKASAPVDTRRVRSFEKTLTLRSQSQYVQEGDTLRLLRWRIVPEGEKPSRWQTVAPGQPSGGWEQKVTVSQLQAQLIPRDS